MTNIEKIEAAAKRFGEFVASAEGRAHLKVHGLAGTVVIVCNEHESVQSVMRRAEDHSPSQPVALAVHFDDDTMRVGSCHTDDVSEVDGSPADPIDPHSEIGMVVQLAVAAGGIIRFQLTRWQSSVSLGDLTAV